MPAPNLLIHALDLLFQVLAARGLSWTVDSCLGARDLSLHHLSLRARDARNARDALPLSTPPSVLGAAPPACLSALCPPPRSRRAANRPRAPPPLLLSAKTLSVIEVHLDHKPIARPPIPARAPCLAASSLVIGHPRSALSLRARRILSFLHGRSTHDIHTCRPNLRENAQVLSPRLKSPPSTADNESPPPLLHSRPGSFHRYPSVYLLPPPVERPPSVRYRCTSRVVTTLRFIYRRSTTTLPLLLRLLLPWHPPRSEIL